jgi:3-deoxy-D-manno-octulosonic-acid transferase
MTPLLLLAYRAATAIIEPFAPLLLHARARRGKEDLGRLAERLGRASAPRPEGPLVWLHGVSVGEALSLLPLVRALRHARPDVGLLVTSGTQTSAALLAQRLPPGVIHQYAPIDGPGACARFMRHWRPDLGVFVESELWPNLLTAARRRNVTMALLSAKLSDRSAQTWSRAPAMARSLLESFSLLLAQDEPAAERFLEFGVCADGVADLKFGADPLPADAARLESLRAALGDRPIILAASTHTGEDEIIVERFQAILQEPGASDRRPLLVIVPRHPDRGAAIAALAGSRGLGARLQSAAATPGEDPVFVADVLGELGLWYRLAGLAVIGGSLREGLSGHNPLEPARLDCPFISGVHVANWATAFAELRLARATRLIKAPSELDACFRLALTGDAGLPEMAALARTYVERRDEEARAVPDLVLGLLP